MEPGSNNVNYYILIVDDDKDDHFFLRRAINTQVPQAIVESLYDGSEALIYLDRCDSLPNLIFLDLNMTKISGKETIRIIRKNPVLNKVPVVVLTTSINPVEREEVLGLGADAFYSKPGNTGDLVKIVADVRERWLVRAAAC